MNNSFSPGPWVMTEEGEEDLVVCSSRGDFICTPSGTTFGEAVDNARLIAAAPQLLEALQEMEDAVNFMQENWKLQARPHYAINASRLHKTRAAIKLATGQEP